MRPAVRTLKAALFGLCVGAGLLATTMAHAEEEGQPKKISYGLFGLGLHVEAGAGVYQVVGQNGWVPGIYPRIGAELHLGPHFSIPVIARLQTSVAQGVPDFAQMSVSAGVNLRFRETEWPFAIVVGAGVRFGQFTASKELTDPNFQTTTDQGAQDALGFPLAPEGTAKVEWWIAAPLALKASVTYAPVFMPNQTIHNIEEALAIALVF